MKVLSLSDQLSSDISTVVSVGNFDGVHRGHRILIKEVMQRAEKKNSASALVTFEPHTRVALYPELPHQLLTTFEEKAILIQKYGIDYLLKIPFNKSFSTKSAESFMEDVLFSKLHMIEWIMGEGHAVGKNRSGGKKFLHEAMGKYHIPIFTADLLKNKAMVVSSTQIRKLISEGNLADAVEMLGHPYLISAQRVEGLKIGSQIGVPTLNFKRPPSQKVVPPAGVYAAELEFNDSVLTGALYFGACPTFENRDAHFEFHAFDLKETYPQIGETANIWVHRFIRSDKAFSNTEDLVKHIKIDVNEIRQYFSEEKLQWR